MLCLPASQCLETSLDPCKMQQKSLTSFPLSVLSPKLFHNRKPKLRHCRLKLTILLKYLMFDRIPELRLIHEAIDHLDVSLLLLEGAEHPVPDDEHPGIILVQAVSVGSVMHLVVAGGVEDVVQGAQAGHQLSVDPELVEQVQLLVDDSVAGRDEQGQRKVEWLNRSRLVYVLETIFLL